MPSERIILLLAKRAKGLCSAAELQELDDWYATFSPMEGAVGSNDQIKKSLYLRIRAQLHLPPATHEIEEHEIQPRRGRTWFRLAAASIALLVVAGLVFYANKPGNTPISIATSSDETSKIVLPDSSIVRLKPGSKIFYDKNLGKSATRELYLEGEGFFEISHNTKKPFIVRAGALDIRVLGTVFNVRSDKNTPTVETTLFQGSVRIEKDNGATPLVTLSPNQRAIYSVESEKIKVNQLPKFEEVLIGKSEKTIGKAIPMVFDERPIEELFKQMENKFGINIYIHNRSQLTCPITADLEKENLDEILNLLKISYGVDYALYGTELFIEGSICNK